VHRRQRSGFVFAVALSLVTAPGAVSAQSGPPSSPSAASSAGPAMNLPALTAPLAAGHYGSGVFGPEVTFDLADGDWKGDQQDGLYFELVRQLGDSTGVLSVSLFDGRVANDPCVPDTSGQVDLTAAAFTEWLAGSSALVTSTTPTTIFGQPATQLDATVLATACPGNAWIMLWDGFRLFPSEAARFIAIDQGDKVIVVSAETVQSTDLPDFLDVAQPVIDSLAFSADGAGSPPPDPSPSV
jgi:hypothetical protein